jgi:hypothetical protein
MGGVGCRGVESSKGHGHGRLPNGWAPSGQSSAGTVRRVRTSSAPPPAALRTAGLPRPGRHRWPVHQNATPGRHGAAGDTRPGKNCYSGTADGGGAPRRLFPDWGRREGIPVSLRRVRLARRVHIRNWDDDEVDVHLDWDGLGTTLELNELDAALRRLRAACPHIRWRIRYYEHELGVYADIEVPVEHVSQGERLLQFFERNGGRWPTGRYTRGPGSR